MLKIKDFILHDEQTYTTKYEEHMLLYTEWMGVEFRIMRLTVYDDDTTREWYLVINDQEYGGYGSIKSAVSICNEYIKEHQLDKPPQIVVEVLGGIVQCVRSNRKNIECTVFDFDNKQETEDDRKAMESMYEMTKGMYHIW